MLLKSQRKSRERELRRSIRIARRELRRLERFSLLLLFLRDMQQISTHITTTRSEQNPHIPIRRLRSQRRAQYTQQMEIREIVDLPIQLHTFRCALDLLRARRQRVRAEDDHIQSSGRRVVNPFRSKGADAVEGSEVDLLGGDELVVGLFSQVLNEFDDEGVGEGVLGEEDDLGAAGCEGADCCFTYAGGAALLKLSMLDTHLSFAYVLPSPSRPSHACSSRSGFWLPGSTS